MNISSNVSPKFTSIYLNTSDMNKVQERKANRLYNAIKYSDGYQKHQDGDIDVYIMPAKNNDSALEIRYADLYSGSFIHGKNNHLLKNTYKYNNIYDIADNVVATMDKIANGEIKRPEVDKEKIFNGETDVYQVNPDKLDEIVCVDDELIETMGERGAKEYVYCDYIYSDLNRNKDAEF